MANMFSKSAKAGNSTSKGEETEKPANNMFSKSHKPKIEDEGKKLSPDDFVKNQFLYGKWEQAGQGRLRQGFGSSDPKQIELAANAYSKAIGELDQALMEINGGLGRSGLSVLSGAYLQVDAMSETSLDLMRAYLRHKDSPNLTAALESVLEPGGRTH